MIFMKNPVEQQQSQTSTPGRPSPPDAKQPKALPPKSNWQRYLDGEWDPMGRQSDFAKDVPPPRNH